MEHLGLKDTAYETIKEMLLIGKIPPGQRIREDLLANELSMSRTPVREAINQLYSAGFVDIVSRRGVFAMVVTEENHKELTQVRLALSTLAVRECCRVITDEQVADLQRVLDEYEEVCMQGDVKKRGLCDGMFHKSIARYSGNHLLYTYLCDVEDKAMYARNMENYSYSRADSVSTHKEMMAAISRRDEDAAVEATIRNINHFYISMDY